MNLKKVFLKHCENNVYEINQRQLSIIDNLLDYYKDNFDLLICLYLQDE